MPLKVSDVDILIIPGWTNSGPDHWQTRWERKLPHVRRVEQDDWDRPVCADWVAKIVDAVSEAKRAVVLVAPPDLERAAEPGSDWLSTGGGFHPVPTAPLPFPSMVIASGNDPYVTIERAQEMALDWGSDFADAGPSGHINTASGHGPWPEGLLKLGQLMKRLG